MRILNSFPLPATMNKTGKPVCMTSSTVTTQTTIIQLVAVYDYETGELLDHQVDLIPLTKG